MDCAYEHFFIKETAQSVTGYVELYPIKTKYWDYNGRMIEAEINIRKITTMEKLNQYNGTYTYHIEGMSGEWYMGRDLHSLIKV